jgi:ubiquinone/menaquinone biosynthesis C-methylase UbiE
MASPHPPESRPGINYERLYQFRFRSIDQRSRQAVWDEIARVVYEWLGRPQCVLDPAAGRGEFVNAIPAVERWIIDQVDHGADLAADVKVIRGDAREVELPDAYFDGVFVSNLLEHFPTQEDIGSFLTKMRASMVAGGRIGVLGPNFRYCMRDYFDCADHTLALTDGAIAEHLYAAGFEIERVIPRFVPYSFRSRLPHAQRIVRAYLQIPLAWRFFGRQFLVIGTNPRPSQ